MKPEPQQIEVTTCVCGHRYEQHASRDYGAYCHTACGCTKYVCAEQPEPLPPRDDLKLPEEIVNAVWRCHHIDDDGSVWLDSLKAAYRVKHILARVYPALGAQQTYAQLAEAVQEYLDTDPAQEVAKWQNASKRMAELARTTPFSDDATCPVCKVVVFGYSAGRASVLAAQPQCDAAAAAREIQQMYRATNECLGYEHYEPAIEAVETVIQRHCKGDEK